MTAMFRHAVELHRLSILQSREDTAGKRKAVATAVQVLRLPHQLLVAQMAVMEVLEPLLVLSQEKAKAQPHASLVNRPVICMHPAGTGTAEMGPTIPETEEAEYI